MEAEAEPTPFGRRLGRAGSAICLTADRTPRPTFTLSHSTLAHIHLDFNAAGYWAKGFCCSWNFSFPPPTPKCFKKCRVSKRGWTKRKPTVSRTDTCNNTFGDSTVCPYVMPYEAKGGGRNQCCCCCWQCDCSRWKQEASGVSPWQLSTVLKFTPKELGQWKFMGEKRAKEKSRLELIDMKSLQYNNRWTVELQTVKEMCLNNGKEKRTQLFPSQVALISWYFVVSVWVSVPNFLAGQSGLKICCANKVATPG